MGEFLPNLSLELNGEEQVVPGREPAHTFELLGYFPLIENLRSLHARKASDPTGVDIWQHATALLARLK